MGIPVPARLTLEQIQACESFSRKVFGGPMFDHRPAHRGQHVDRNYPDCVPCLEFLEAERVAAVEREAESERVNAIRQPWELAA